MSTALVAVTASAARAEAPRVEPPSFARTLSEHGLPLLRRAPVKTLQINVGKLCNMACHHCHVEAGPKRTEIMTARTAERLVELVAASPTIEVVDFTGGAPEMNPNFRWLVERMRRLGRHVIDRCNLSVLYVPGMQDLAQFLAAEEVQIVASLPCYQADNVEKQRGKGAFDVSVRALRLLNALGYGKPGSALGLDLVYNPVGASLPPSQGGLERRYKDELGRLFGIEFHRLFTIANMPIKRFAEQLERQGKADAYLSLLVNHFNPSTVDELMCRSTLSVGWDGGLYDCDFNQMLELDLGGGRTNIWDIDSVGHLEGRSVTTAPHCYGCTAGSGSSCTGALR